MPNASIVEESINQLATLINNIVLILEYYVPGFCLVFVYRRFRSNNSPSFSEAIQLGICIVLSYLLHVLWLAGYISLIVTGIGITYFVYKKIRYRRKYSKRKDLIYSILFAVTFSLAVASSFLTSLHDEHYRIVYKIVSAIVLALDLVLLHDEKYAKSVFNWVNNTTLSETIFECSEMKLPCNAIVYGEEKRIEGRLLNYDLASDDAWLLMDICNIYDDHGKMLGSWKTEPIYHQLLVPLSEVKCIKVDADEGKPIDYDKERRDS